MVLTRYKEAPKVEEKKPDRDLSVMEWLSEMSLAGFDGEFVASNGTDQYKGYFDVAKDNKPVVKAKRIPKADEVREKLEKLKKGIA